MSVNKLVYNWIKETDLPDALRIEEDGGFYVTLPQRLTIVHNTRTGYPEDEAATIQSFKYFI